MKPVVSTLDLKQQALQMQWQEPICLGRLYLDPKNKLNRCASWAILVTASGQYFGTVHASAMILTGCASLYIYVCIYIYTRLSLEKYK